MNEFKNGVLKLNLSNKREKQIAISMAFSQNNADFEIYNEALKLIPKIKGLGIKRKAKMVFDIIELVKNKSL